MTRTTFTQSIQAQNSTRKNTLSCQEPLYLFTSTLYLLLAHASSPISKSIHISPLITTIKKNKIVSLFFNVGLNIFITLHIPYSFPYLYIYVITFIHFNYLILKCSNSIYALVAFYNLTS